MSKIIVYCDGACSGNQFSENKGGWGAVLKYGDVQKEICGGEANTTNNRMELKACIEALKLITDKTKEVEVNTDSAYLCNCMNSKWYVGWEKNGWRNSQKKPVENKDLWVELLKLMRSFQNIKFNKVKGHSGVELNELADQLANKGMNEFEELKNKDSVDWTDDVVYKVYCNDDLESLPVLILQQMENHIRSIRLKKERGEI